jgi:acetyltransferase
MHRGKHSREMMVGLFRDPVFGPVVSFGLGGTQVEVLGDHAVALPPLNRLLIRTLIHQTKAARLLDEFRGKPAVDREALEQVLLRVSEMACELPWIREMDINPLLVDAQGAVAVDARIRLGHVHPAADAYAHMAIHPYPVRLVRSRQLGDGTDITVRPIRPEDADMVRSFINGLSDEAKYFRFMRALHEVTQEMLVRFSQIDYQREMALIATAELDGKETELGVARYVTNPDAQSCEFALVVGDRWQRRGLGHILMQALMQVARERGLERMEGEVLANNSKMLELVRNLGFRITVNQDDLTVRDVVISL